MRYKITSRRITVAMDVCSVFLFSASQTAWSISWLHAQLQDIKIDEDCKMTEMTIENCWCKLSTLIIRDHASIRGQLSDEQKLIQLCQGLSMGQRQKQCISDVMLSHCDGQWRKKQHHGESNHSYKSVKLLTKSRMLVRTAVICQKTACKSAQICFQEIGSINRDAATTKKMA